MCHDDLLHIIQCETKSLFGHDRGVKRQFPELLEPPRPPTLNFHLIRLGEGKMCSDFGEDLVTTISYLFLSDVVSNKRY